MLPAAEKASELRTENRPVDLPGGGIAKSNFSGTTGDKAPLPLRVGLKENGNYD